MSTKVKGLLKGLRYISQIFEEKEDDFQIGFPTDVKHVAHIGSDDPSANAPSWMTEFKPAKEGDPSGTVNEMLEDDNNSSNAKGTHSKSRHMVPKSRHQSIDSETKQKHTRRSHRSSDPSADTSANESSGGSRHRRNRRGSNHGGDSPSQEMPPTGAKTHRRKSKNSEDGSVRKPSSRRSSKGDSLTDISISDFGSGSGPETKNEAQ
ncbi:CRIB domain-containing protein RIC1-like [Abrus precatorius]|uniref:CRIB domain-containing protein RIC1-like n=1 Tax=Abrus precatorius TaxID=3816 RepID=A0A8B8M6U7_ABRPR|nr:CRIB domain-containing protein RIC1-like [Abrus precatorius]